MTQPRIGACITLPHFNGLRDWLFDQDRPIEMQDFVQPDVIMNETTELVAQWQTALKGHTGPRGIHGPFYGLDVSNPDPEIRAVVQKRLIKGVEIAAALQADLMVVHSPFNFWHVLNYANYEFLRPALMEASIDCLTPVLASAQTHGVTLALENIDDTNPADRADLADQINHPLLRLSVDTGHADLAHGNYGAPPVVDALSHAGDRLAHVHLQDVDGYADRHWHPGDGRIPWRPVIECLEQHPGDPRLLLEIRSRMERIPQTAAWLEGFFTPA